MSDTNKQKVQVKEINGHIYVLFKNGRVDRLPFDLHPNGLTLNEIKAAIEFFSIGDQNLEVVN